MVLTSIYNSGAISLTLHRLYNQFGKTLFIYIRACYIHLIEENISIETR